MARRSRWLTALAAGFAMLVSMLAFSSAASAYPPGTSVTITISSSNPDIGATITVGGANWKSGTMINVTLHTATYNLGSATAGADGSFSTSVTLPSGVSGEHTVVATDPATGESASVPITIGTTGATSGGGGGGLAATGVAVMGIGGLGVLLLIGGGVMLMVGKRRRTTV